ncbi:penicillin-binding protein 2 [bacterium]|nr:MAG: penicillin-binding protein 2 [bacterium]
MVKGRKKKKERTLWDEDLNRARLTRSKRRAHIIEIILFFCFFAVFVRLFFLMVLDHGELMQKAEQQYKKVRTLKPHRGVIWDNNMRQMAVSIETKSLYAVPSQIHDVKGLTTKLAPILKVPERKLRKKILSKREKDFLWIKRKMDERVYRRVSMMKHQMARQQLGVLSETKRYYPKGQVASHVLGYTDIDNDGLDGIELKYDQYIKGETKKVWLGRDARGYGLSKGPEDGLPGNDLILTIDENIQYIVEREIGDALKEWKAEAVVAIMMKPETGAILAMANRPTYDVNYAGKANAARRRNRAITDIYEPGSTFKAILATAVLEEGMARLNEDFDVSKGFIRVPGGRIRDVHKHKILSFKEVIQKSSNVGSVQLGMRLGEETYYRYIRNFGFGEKTGIDLIGEVKGLLRSPENWSGRSLASLSIGQEIGTTPLQILRAYAAIANGGKLMRPFLVSRIISPSGEVIKHFSPVVEKRVMSHVTAGIMRDILKSVVEEGGTARKASVRGNIVAGKTGTAQMIDPETRRYSSKDYVSSFVGFIPADNPEIALIVVVYKPRGARYGGVVAAPVFRKIVEHTFVYLDIPMGKEDKNVILVSTSR